MPQPLTPQEILTKAYDEYSDAIFRHCYFRVFNRERGKELMQETFMRAWEYLLSEQEILNIRAFLYRIANNLIIDESRKKKEMSLDALQEQGFDPAGKDEVSTMKSRLEEQRVLETLKKIDSSYRETFVMRHIDGLSPAEIAEIIGESTNTVSVRLHRAVKQLRVLLNKNATT